MRRWRREVGLDGEVGFEARVLADLERSPEEWRRTAEEWKELGASHLAVRTCVSASTLSTRSSRGSRSPGKHSAT